MDHYLLIDFSSPLKDCVNILDPLVPLPKVHTSVPNNESVAVVGDNPFDNIFSQLCSEDDPFDMMERKAHETECENHSTGQKIVKATPKEINIGKNPSVAESLGSAEKTIPKVSPADVADIPSSFNQTSFRLERSFSESNLSPVSGKIQDKFSKLYMSAQFDQQILDESSKCVDSGMQDMSVGSNSHYDLSFKSFQTQTFNLPKREEDIKAFVADRIEKCIEKAVTETRKSLNSSFRHRRSLSAASLYNGFGPCAMDCLRPASSDKQYNEKLLSSLTSKHRSSSHDLLSTLETIRMKIPVGSIYDKCETERSLISDKFNTGFRRSTATSSMYSSCGLLETGFRRSTTTLPNSLKRSSSFSLSSTLPHQEDNSVFTHSTMNMDNKSSDHVLMEAKNLSFLLHRKAYSDGDEPMDYDDNFLANDKCEVDLVDSDSSLSGEEMVTDTRGRVALSHQLPTPGVGCVKEKSRDRKQVSSIEVSKRCSQGSVAKSIIQSVSQQIKKVSSPVLVPPLAGSLSSGSNSKELLFRPKANSERSVVKRGPMKAMIPVGNMVRSDPAKEPPVPMKGLQLRKLASKSVAKVNAVVRSVSEGGQNSLIKKLGSVVSCKTDSPMLPVGRPVACSTPAVESLPPRTSPETGLQVSHISPSPPSDGNHRRSRSAGCRKDTETDEHLSNTPVRKVSRRIRSEDGRLKSKQKSPNHERMYTSTPLKAIPKNSPKINRVRQSSLTSRKLLHQTEKENRQPHHRVPLISSR